MASESVKILIEAEDLASAKIAQASQKIEQNVKDIKSVGQKAKASTEFIGQLANQLGGSEIAGFAGQLAGLTEKVSQFSEVSKAGGAGAFAFKAGIVGLVGAMSFGFGQAIGNAIFETDRWKKELEGATEASKKLNAELIRFSDLRIGDQIQSISLLGSPEEQEKATAALVESLRDQARQAAKISADSRAELKAMSTFDDDANIFGSLGVETNAKQRRDELELQIKLQDDLSNSISKQAVELERKLNFEMQNAKVAKQTAETQASSNYIASLREQLAIEKAIGDEKFKLEAQKTAKGTDVSVAAGLLKELDAQKQLVEAANKAAREKEQKIKEEEASRKRIIDLISNENQKNQERLVLLGRGTDVIAEMQKKLADPATTQSEAERLKIQTKILQDLDRQRGTESQMQSERLQAAKAIAFIQQGVSQTEAERLAAESERISRLEKDKQNREEVNKTLMQPQEAFQSRFLTRGPMSNPNERLEKEAEKQTRLQEEQRKLLEALRENTKPRPVNVKDVRLEVVG
jgi:hypothetical protein